LDISVGNISVKREQRRSTRRSHYGYAKAEKLRQLTAKDTRGKPVDEDSIGKLIVPAAMHVHTALGAGLLESAYEACLAYELAKHGLMIERQVSMPVIYESVRLDVGYRIDLLLGQKVVVEIKAVDRVIPAHLAQILTYLKLGGYKLGFLLNFNVAHMRDGIKRVVNGL
jgi:GxxExxY protein